MPNHDRYENDILKTLQRMAGALERIDLTLRDNNSEKNERIPKINIDVDSMHPSGIVLEELNKEEQHECK